MATRRLSRSSSLYRDRGSSRRTFWLSSVRSSLRTRGHQRSSYSIACLRLQPEKSLNTNLPSPCKARDCREITWLRGRFARKSSHKPHRENSFAKEKRDRGRDWRG